MAGEISTRHALYRAILAALQTGVTSIDDSRVYLAAFPVLDETVDRAIQIVHVGSESEDPIAGCGLVYTTFTVAYWVSMMRDHYPHADNVIADATDSAFALAEEIRATLRHSTLSNAATVAVTFLRDGTIQTSDQNPGYLYGEDTFRVGWDQS